MRSANTQYLPDSITAVEHVSMICKLSNCFGLVFFADLKDEITKKNESELLQIPMDAQMTNEKY